MFALMLSFASMMTTLSRHFRVKQLGVRRNRYLTLEGLENRLNPIALTFYWVGGTSTAWDEKSNWGLLIGGEPTRYPGQDNETRDVVNFDQRAMANCFLNVDATVRVLQTGVGATAFTKVFEINAGKHLTIQATAATPPQYGEFTF